MSYQPVNWSGHHPLSMKAGHMTSPLLCRHCQTHSPVLLRMHQYLKVGLISACTFTFTSRACFTGLLSDMTTVPSGPVSSLEGSPSLSRITVSWDGIAANAVIIRYEVQYASTDGSSVITNYTGSPPFVIEERNHGTNYTFSVTPFSLFARGQSVERTVQTLSEPRRSQLVPQGNLASLLLLLPQLK